MLMTVLAMAAPVPAAPVSVRDDLGEVVRLPQPARRIVSLSPGLTETLFQIGAGDRLVAVDLASDFPAAAAELPRVGSIAGVDRERLLALQPDLVVLWGSGSRAGLVDWLRRSGIAVYVSEPRELDQIATTMERLGRLSGRDQEGTAAAAAFRQRAQSLRRRYHRQPPWTVFYQVWHDPLITVNGGQFISQVIDLCGGSNVFAGLAGSAPQISVEAVLARDPQFLVAGVAAGQSDPLAHWRRWPFLQAVRRGNLIRVPADLLQRPSARLLDGAQRLCAAMRLASETPSHR